MKEFEKEAEETANAFDLDEEKSKLLEELDHINAAGEALGTEKVDVLQSSIAQIEAFIDAALRGKVKPEDIQDIIDEYNKLNEKLEEENEKLKVQ